MGSGPVREVAPRPKRSLIRRLLRWTIRGIGLTVLLLVGLVVLAPEWVLPPVGQYLDVSEPPERVDYVLVLNGDPETRPFAAAALVKAGLAREVLLTRQQLTLESDAVNNGVVLSELELTRRILQARGVPAEAIRVLPGQIGSTFDEARVLAEFLDDQPSATVVVVTNYFHTRRARWAFRRVLGPRAEQVTLVGVPRDGIDERRWWRNGQGCVIYLSEYGKLLYYVLRY